MIATAMECKRLGLCHKSLFAVPNHLTEQVGADFLKLYPNANILVATKDDFKSSNRKMLMSKIATGNYDAVIIGHTQLKMLPLSPERQEAFLQSQIDDIVAGLAEMKAQDGNKFTVKEMERTKRISKISLRSFNQVRKTIPYISRSLELTNCLLTKLTNLRICTVQQSCKMFRVYLQELLRGQQSCLQNAVILTKRQAARVLYLPQVHRCQTALQSFTQ